MNMRVNKLSAIAISGFLATSLAFPVISSAKHYEGHMIDREHFNPEEIKKKIDEHFKKIHEELKITPEQQKAWDNYVEATKKEMDHWAKEFKEFRDHEKNLTPPEALKDRVKFAEDNIPLLKDREKKLDDLYKMLSPEQKKKADELLTERHMKMKHKAKKLKKEMEKR